ncbi:MAG: hypothetical protein PHG61_03300 [Candidatus Marinimicrobia bacterium]|nr:hypothetical protein [Candidatus Neomarinimicrobiota bacterium]
MDKRIFSKAPIGAVKDLKVIDPKTIPHVLEEGELGVALEWMVRDTKTGEVTEHVIKRSESYVRGFLDLFYVQTNQISRDSLYQLRDTSNALQDVAQSAYSFRCNAGAGIITHGIMVGTDNTAPTINDYKIGTLIAHGVGAGQLQYGAVTFGAPASDATTSQFTITRNFANASGGVVTVEEVGLYNITRTYATSYYIMTIRDVTGGIAVPNGQTLTVNYRPQAVV